MSSDRRFEQELPFLLDDLYMGPMPTYRDHVLEQTTRTRQRPAWSFLERWLPMVDIARQPLSAPRLPWRTIGLALVLLALLVATVSALLLAGRPRLPAPFGPARNGFVAYASGGDIYTADPLSGGGTALVTGPETDLKPVWSGNGLRFVFERKVIGDAGDGRLFVARADGSQLVAITPQPQSGLASYAFSPDGSEVAFTSGPDTNSELWIAKADGTGVRRIDVGMSVREPSYRPPNGAEIVFAGDSAIGAGIYAVDVATGTVRTIVTPSGGAGLDWVTVASDGSRVAYSASTADPSKNTYRVQVSALDGSRTLTLPMPQGATFQDGPAWSNDSTRIAVIRGYAARNQEITLAVLPADGSTVGVETDRGLTGCCDTVYEWAPDDKSILMSPEDQSGQTKPQLLIDPLTGASRPTPWGGISDPAWQRLGAWQRLAP
jgi:Tol biopolymer transport system component